MKRNILLLLTLASAFSFAYSKDMEQFSVTPGTCKCYCSDLCGPRDVKADDTPFYDEEYGLCFCKPRDKANYIPHECHLKNPKPEFESCCDKTPTRSPERKKTKKLRK